MMNAIQKAVVARLVSDKDSSAASGEIEAGKHPVDFHIHVTGVFDKGEKFEQMISNKIDHKSLFAAAMEELRKAGLKVELADLVAASRLPETKEMAKALSVETQAVMDVIQAPTLTECNGKITGVKKLTIEVVSGKEAPLEPASA